MCKHKDLELSFVSISGVSVPCGFVCACGYEYDLYELAEKHKAHIEKDEKRSESTKRIARRCRDLEKLAGEVMDENVLLWKAVETGKKTIKRLKAKNV